MQETTKKLKISYWGTRRILHRTVQIGFNNDRKTGYSAQLCQWIKEPETLIWEKQMLHKSSAGSLIKSTVPRKHKNISYLQQWRGSEMLAFWVGLKKKPYPRLANDRKRLKWAKGSRCRVENDWKRVIATLSQGVWMTLKKLCEARNKWKDALDSLKHSKGNTIVWRVPWCCLGKQGNTRKAVTP